MVAGPSRVWSGDRVRAGQVADLVDLVVADDPTRPRGLILTGAPGIGKSTTLEALGRRLLAGGRDTRRVGTGSAAQVRPFAVVTDLLGLEPVHPPRPDSGDHIVAAAEQLCRVAPLVLCVDDAHRCDPDSLDVLARLHDLTDDLPLTLVLARRGVGDRTALSALGRRPGMCEIEVLGLTGSAVDELVRTRCGAPPSPGLRALLLGADGNPLRIRAVLDDLDRRGALQVCDDEVRAADGAVTASVEAGLRAQLASLDAPARDLVRILAAWGGPADVATLADVQGTGPAAPIEPARLAVGLGVLRWTADDRLAFSHDLYRDVVLADLEPPVARALHAACAVTSRRQGAGPLTVARHTARAAGPDAPAALLAAAADLEHAPLHAADLLAEAAGHVDDDSPLADDVAVERAGALAITGQVEAAERVARERLARSRTPGVCTALRSIVLFCLLSDAQIDAALDEIDLGLARIRSGRARAELVDLRRWVRLLGGRGVVEGPPARPAETGSGLISDAIELFLTGDPERGRWRATEATRVRSRDRSRPWLDSPTAPVWPAYLALHAEGPVRARELSLRTRREAQQTGRLWLTPFHQSVSAGINFLAGAWDDALAEIVSALEAADATGTAWTSTTTATRLQIAVHRGELDEAATILRRWRTRALPEQFGLPHVTQAEVALLEARGEPERAAELARRAWCDALDSGRVMWALLAGPDTLRVARAAGDAELAARVVRDTAAVPLGRARASAPAARLTAAMAAGDPDEAAAAAGDVHGFGHGPGATAGWEEAACLAAARGDAATARAHAEQCGALAGSVGAVTVERRLAARLRAAGLRQGVRGSRRRPASGWESLTPTELRIAELVGQGLTSPQVAARLYISPRTVQTHISHILRKLGLRSRVELAAQLSLR
ncbi:LuxR C-terminal-related transcriptional regulator [Pseudonocardia nematodicida]|uniref:helix-turn-helix transcriptional regulator n=1 Tax=Pseudonocardia nematodicida TaxID=1206997 RepID=UPI003623C110